MAVPSSSSRAARVEVCGGNGLQRGADGSQQAAAVGCLAAGPEDARASGSGRHARSGHDCGVAGPVRPQVVVPTNACAGHASRRSSQLSPPRVKKAGCATRAHCRSTAQRARLIRDACTAAVLASIVYHTRSNLNSTPGVIPCTFIVFKTPSFGGARYFKIQLVSTF